MKGRIVQDARLFLQKEGEEKIRHIKNWHDYENICTELRISPGYDERSFLDAKDFPPIGRPITEWPEKEPNYKVGPERIMFCVGPNDDFQKIKDLGITVIQHYSIYWEEDQNGVHDYGLSYLNKAAKYGLEVLYCMKPTVHDLIVAGGAWDKENSRRIIESFDSHPALWGWQPYDEPDAGVDHPKYLIPMDTQREIYQSFKQWGMEKSFVHVLRGATRGWHLVDLTLGDLLMADSYVYNGTGKCWGLEPLAALEVALKQDREYLDSNNIQMPTSFIFQCSMVPEKGIDPHTPLPEGIIEDQFNLVRGYGLSDIGPVLWAWNHGYYGPENSGVVYQEIKDLFDKIKED